MTLKTARAIYRSLYWNPLRAEALPLGVDLSVFDMGVNAGICRSPRLLQRALGFTGEEVDGSIGPETLAAADRFVARSKEPFPSSRREDYLAEKGVGGGFRVLMFVLACRRVFSRPHNGRSRPDRFAITDNGSRGVGSGPRAWACLYCCHIQSCGSCPPRLNQSSIWAVESTWSSSLPFGKTVSSCRYSASYAASFGRWTKPFSIIAVCACMRMTLSDCGW